jgi:hypothetical protein
MGEVLYGRALPLFVTLKFRPEDMNEANACDNNAAICPFINAGGL